MIYLFQNVFLFTHEQTESISNVHPDVHSCIDSFLNY